MKYYKLIWDFSSKLYQIPGFVWPNEIEAIANYDEFIGWTHGETKTPHLYVMESENPIQFPLAFSSRLSHNHSRRPPRTLSDDELESTFKYFSTKDADFFSMRDSTEDDVLLFLDFAASSPPLKSAYNSQLDEYSIGKKTRMGFVK